MIPNVFDRRLGIVSPLVFVSCLDRPHVSFCLEFSYLEDWQDSRMEHLPG